MRATGLSAMACWLLGLTALLLPAVMTVLKIPESTVEVTIENSNYPKLAP